MGRSCLRRRLFVGLETLNLSAPAIVVDSAKQGRTLVGSGQQPKSTAHVHLGCRSKKAVEKGGKFSS